MTKYDFTKDGRPVDPNHPWNRPQLSHEKEIAQAVANRLAVLETAYADGNMGALENALSDCEEFQQPLPAWVVKALREVIARDLRGEKNGERGKSKWVTRYAQDIEDYDRYEAVLEAREQGIKWLAVPEAVSQMLYGHTNKAHTVEAAYKRVKKRIKINPGRYLVIKKPK